MRVNRLLVGAVSLCVLVLSALAAETGAPGLSSIAVSNGVKSIRISPAPAIDLYTIRSSGNVTSQFTNEVTGVLGGLTYKVTNSEPMKFYTVVGTPLSSNSLLSANLLNRIAYGPTPDDLERLVSIGPQAYINEQLAPEAVADTFDTFATGVVTNGSPNAGVPQWRNITVTGTFSSSNFFISLLAGGDAFIDDIELRPFITVITTNDFVTNIVYVTNSVPGTNVLLDGDFEAVTLTPPWIVPANVAGSSLSTTTVHSGSRSLHLVSSVAGSNVTDSISQNLTNLWFSFASSSTQRVQLSFWFFESSSSSKIKLRLDRNGLNGCGNDTPPAPEWFYTTATGTGAANKEIFIHLNGAGECYVDDLKLVAGTVAEAGANLLRNGDCESPMNGTNNWYGNGNHAGSFIDSNISHSGSSSLHIVATGQGTTFGSSVVETNLGITSGGTYTVSFWSTLPSNSRTVTNRLSGSGLIAAQPLASPATIRHRLETINSPDLEDGSVTVNNVGGANLSDLRSWFVQNCVGNKRQLMYVLLQFIENHFVTQHSKSVDYFDRFYDDGNLMDILATDLEYREQTKWRNALMGANCSFYDLLRISAESPAMIVYLDSVDSNGSGASVANENYAREVMELFCMGVDNGYDQQDITVMSRYWSGWSVDIVDPWNVNNPFAPKSQRVGFYPGVGSVGTSNLIGSWAFNFKSASHGTNRAPVWCLWDTNTTNPKPIGVKTVPPRFGPPWANQAYNLYPTNAVPVRSGTNGIQDAYDVLAAIANLPFTMEFISVKLCRLFVHDDFEHGVYDYTDPNRSAEAELVRQCMVAWNTPAGDGRKGNIRSILSVIFNSDLFRSHGSSMQKVKTPLEFAVSAIRALRASNGSGGFYGATDGYSIVGRSRTPSYAPLTRMGSMMLFDRDAPDGYSEVGPPWISSGTLAERVRFIQTTLMQTTNSSKTDSISGGNNNVTDPVGLIKKKLPSNQWSDAAAMADYFLYILFPGEGRGNLGDYRQLAIDFLNTSDDGTTQSLFNTLVNTSAAYDTRVRAMVSMLMTLPRFQEQ